MSDEVDKVALKVLSAALSDKMILDRLTREFEPASFPKSQRAFADLVWKINKEVRAEITQDVLSDYVVKNIKSNEVSIAVQKTFADCQGHTCTKDEFKYFYGQFKKYRADRILREALQGKDEDGNALIEKGKTIESVVELLADKKDPMGASKILKEALAKIESLSKEDPIIRVTMRERASEKYQEYESKKKNPNQAMGYLTGFGPLDDATFGIGKGEIFIVAARPGKGKSITLVNVAKTIFKAGHSVMLLSLEMPYVQYEDRFISSYAGVSNTRMRLGALTEEEEKRLKAAWEEVGDRKSEFEIIDFPKINAFQIEAELTRALDRYTPDVVIIDYLGIMKPNDKGSTADWETQGKIVEEVRQVTRQFNVATMSAVQLNRSKSKEAGTDRLSRSDIIGATADCIFMINDDEDNKDSLSDVMKFTMIKNRKGADNFEFEMYKNLDLITIKNLSTYKSRIEELLKGAKSAT